MNLDYSTAVQDNCKISVSSYLFTPKRNLQSSWCIVAGNMEIRLLVFCFFFMFCVIFSLYRGSFLLMDLQRKLAE